MNAEEIIEELRCLSKNDECVFTAEAADLIESLQAQLELEHGGALAAAENCLRLQGEVNDLQAQLAIARRRAEKALGYIKKIVGCDECVHNDDDTNYETCKRCNIYDNWRWRGDAEEGDAK